MNGNCQDAQELLVSPLAILEGHQHAPGQAAAAADCAMHASCHVFFCH